MELYDDIKEINELSLSEKGTRMLIQNLGHSPIVMQAIAYGAVAHMFHMRKHTGVPYLTHPIAVASILALVTSDDNILAAAVLHDVVEDIDGYENEDIQKEFGADIAELVENMTDASKPEDGNRKVRKEIDRQHSAKSTPRGQTLKLADLIHNTFSIVEHDASFAKLYLAEKLLLLDVLTDGNKQLRNVAKKIAADGLATLRGAAKSAAAFVEN